MPKIIFFFFFFSFFAKANCNYEREVAAKTREGLENVFSQYKLADHLDPRYQNQEVNLSPEEEKHAVVYAKLLFKIFYESGLDADLSQVYFSKFFGGIFKKGAFLRKESSHRTVNAYVFILGFFKKCIEQIKSFKDNSELNRDNKNNLNNIFYRAINTNYNVNLNFVSKSDFPLGVPAVSYPYFSYILLHKFLLPFIHKYKKFFSEEEFHGFLATTAFFIQDIIEITKELDDSYLGLISL